MIWRLPAPSHHSGHGRLTPANIGFDGNAIDGQPDGHAPVASARWLMRLLHLRQGQP